MIDCGGICEEMDGYIEDNNAVIEYILLTHGHFDHIRAAEHYRKKYGAKITRFETFGTAPDSLTRTPHRAAA